MKIGDTFIMPAPQNDDCWTFGGFVARITDILDNMVIVEDQDSDFFSIEKERVERTESVN